MRIEINEFYRIYLSILFNIVSFLFDFSYHIAFLQFKLLGEFHTKEKIVYFK